MAYGLVIMPGLGYISPALMLLSSASPKPPGTLVKMPRLAVVSILVPALMLFAGSAGAVDLTEGFEDIQDLPGKGWVQRNNSVPLGIEGWSQGDSGEFSAQSGTPDSYISANFNSAADLGTISNWLLTPEVVLSSQTRISFWTRASDPEQPPFPDRLEVRLSTSGDSVDVGTTAESVGSFTTVLLTINPTLTGQYPTTWTQYEIELDGIPEPTTGRIGFRYYVTDSGPFGDNGDLIGIDSVSITQPGDVIFRDRFEAGAKP